MLSNALQTIIAAAVSTELIDAKRIHGERYASAHEGYGVLMEELHESAMELRDLDSIIQEQLMEDLQQNDSTGIIASLADVELYARKLACEAVQVAAVARKYSETMATQKEADLLSDLKPCPFCGGEAELRDGFAYLDTTKYVTCKNCHTRQQAEQKVRDMWNRRYHHD